MVLMPASSVLPPSTYDRSREKEFYRYYDPILQLGRVGPQFSDPSNLQAAKTYQPYSSPDLSLTAFCQLGALRLRVRRCMLFFFDCKNAYVLAEATQSLSLQDDNSFSIGDGLWLGNAVIPRGHSVCEHTVNAVAQGLGDQDAGVHIITDIKADATFCSRPYVVDGPKARFYAGVPIVTSSGFKIGAFCALDDKPRDGIDSGDVDFLRYMARIVMGHLESVREKAEYRKGSRMLNALGDLLHPPMLDDVPRGTDQQESSPLKVGPNGVGGLSDDKTGNADGSEASATASPNTDPIKSDTNVSNANETKTSPTLLDIATRVLRDAVQADHCLVLDAGDMTPSNTPLLPQNHDTASSTDYFLAQSDEEAINPRSQPTQPASLRANAVCQILSESHRTDSQPANDARIKLPRTLFRRLLRRYPRGKIWLMDDDDTPPPSPNAPSIPRSKRETGRGARTADIKELQTYIPEASSICFVGLWEQTRQRWTGGFLFWTTDPHRLFTASGELTYALALSEIVTAEMSHLSLVKERIRRADFMSSISHELRSPLHGILGSVDLMQSEDDHQPDPVHLSQIEDCASNMLELIEHLLSYAETRGSATRKGNLTDNVTTAQLPRPPRRRTPDGCTYIAKTTEEIANVLWTSHQYDTTSSRDDDLHMTLDISASPQHTIAASPGQWKRVCMALLSNALKFTTDGYVSMRLAVETINDAQVAILAITDTGCGMSKDFVENGLFRSFSQENQLVTGMGLGMHLVKRLVGELGGNISVTSQERRGTTVKVTFPVRTDESRAEDERLRGTSIHVQPSSGATDTPAAIIATNITKTCRQLGAAIVSNPDDADLVILAGADASKSLDFPTIFVARDERRALKMQKTSTDLESKHRFEVTVEPCGPLRLAGAIRTCLGLGSPKEDPITTVDEKDLPNRSIRRSKLIEVTRSLNPHQVANNRGAKDSRPDSNPDVIDMAEKAQDKFKSANKTGSDDARDYHFLLVDDNPINLRLLTSFAKKQGWPYLSATNGSEAVSAYQEMTCGSQNSNRTVIVLLDINMPVMDGYEAAGTIRRIEKGSGIKNRARMIALTGLGSEEAQAKALGNGFDRFITKPVRMKQLAELVGEMTGP